MMKWTGKLEYRDIEGGCWTLRTGGESLVLQGDIPEELAGQRVEVDGTAQEGVSLFMAGPVIDVRMVKPVS